MVLDPTPEHDVVTERWINMLTVLLGDSTPASETDHLLRLLRDYEPYVDEPSPLAPQVDDEMWNDGARGDHRGRFLVEVGAAMAAVGTLMQVGGGYGEAAGRVSDAVVRIFEQHGRTAYLPPMRLPRLRRRVCSVCGGAVPVEGVDKPAVTYAIKRQRWVKIGKTQGPVEQRWRALCGRPDSVTCPPEMDLTAPAGIVLTIGQNWEHALHERLYQSHAAGEWFLDSPSLRKVLRETQCAVNGQ